MRRILAATAAVAMVVPNAVRADELSDVKAQLETAVKSIQALQERVRTLEEQKAKAEAQKKQAAATVPANVQAAVPSNARAAVFLPVKAAPVAPSPYGAPVVAPNEKPVVTVPGRDARLELYGAAQLDAIYDIKRVDPQWEATLRPSKIPVNCPPVGTDPGCGTHGETTLSARQSTFGVKGFLPTEAGEIKTQFEFDLFGMGNDAGNRSCSTACSTNGRNRRTNPATARFPPSSSRRGRGRSSNHYCMPQSLGRRRPAHAAYHRRRFSVCR